MVFENQQLSYQELNTKANQLAHYLMTLGVEAETLVGIRVERSLEMIVGLLGIIKAGGVYVPLDPAYPMERLVFMLKDTQVSILLTQQRLVGILPEYKVQTVCLDSDWETIASESKKNPVSGVKSINLAYTIYTSGSTGHPKGVQISHQNATNLLKITRSSMFNFDESDVWTVFHSYAFDFSVWEIWEPLVSGCQLVVVPHWMTQSPEAFYNLLCKERVTVLNQTPSAMQQLLQFKEETRDVVKELVLRLIICGGETFPRKLALQLLEWDVPIWNFYGPTEATVWASINQVEAINTTEGTFSIGRPLANTQLYVLDVHLQPVPVGVPGELCIAGAGLARGYLNRPKLSKEKFIEIEVFGKPQRFYKTGDLARWLPDGNLEYLGRLDHQVKLRGFRIELGEIEVVLVQHSEVREAVVIIREDQPGDKRLVAYLVPKAQEVMPSTLRQFLKEKLPDYMVPSTFVKLEAMPLTPNGKVDRRALPAPEQTQDNHKSFVAPQDKLEQQLANLWEKVLHVHPIGRHDNFFERGGHSLLAVTLLAQIEKAFGKGLSMMTVFQAPTIAQFADILRDHGYKATWRTLEAIQPHGSGSPLFFIGSTNYARALAPSLGSEQPVYGLNLFGIQPTDGTTPSLTVEWIARQYIQEIQTVQPEGPYYLCGYCGDAKVAFEMAQQLQAQKQSVALLAFIDVVWRTSSTPLQNRYVRFWHNLLEFGLNYLFCKIQQKIKFLQDRLFLASSQLRKKHYQQAGKALPLDLQHKLLIKSFFKALAHYMPQPYPGRITLFLSYEWRSKQTPVLAELAAEGVEIHEIPGYHHNLFESSKVDNLGILLKRCLERRS